MRHISLYQPITIWTVLHDLKDKLASLYRKEILQYELFISQTFVFTDPSAM